MLTRKTFIYGAGSAFAVPAFAMSEEKPLWTAGLMTDTHIGDTEESCERVRLAYELLNDLGVDLVANCGDIAERYTERGYKILRRIFDRTFTKKKPQEIWVYANHEHVGRKDEPFETVMRDVRKHLRIPHDLYALIDFKGFPLVVLPQWLDVERAEKMLGEAARKYPGKPIFVFDHVPAQGTTESSLTWGNMKRRELLNRYPQVVQFSGHVHGSLRCERRIWQGEFTALNLGGLAGWSGSAVGAAPAMKKEFCVAVMEVFSDRLVFKRIDVRDRCEHRSEERWTVPLPFDPATAPYRVDSAAKREVVPQFKPGAKVSLSADASPARSVKVSFPQAEAPHGVYMYKIEVADGETGEVISRQDQFGSFWMRPEERPAQMECVLSAAYFDAGCRRTVSVTPMNCFGVCGEAIKGELTLDSVAGVPVWESADIAKDCVFRRYLKDGEIKRPKDGWYEMHPGDNRLELPKGVWDAPAGTRFRFTVDMESETFTPRPWTIVLRNPEPVENANTRIYTAAGKTPKHRVVIEFAKRKADRNYYLLVREGGPGRIRFHKVKIEKLEI